MGAEQGKIAKSKPKYQLNQATVESQLIKCLDELKITVPL